MNDFVKQKLAICMLGAAWVASCSDSCPQGYTEIDSRCQTPVSQELPTTGSDAGASPGDGAVDAGSKPKTTGTGTRDSDTGVSASGAGAGGGNVNGRGDRNQAGAAASAGASGSFEGVGDAAPSADAGHDAATEPTTPDVCAGKSSGAVCDGEHLHHCSDTGTTDIVDTCLDAELCQIGAAASACASCAPGTFRCEAAVLQVCDDSGQFQLLDTCATAALCKETAGACTEMLCQPNAVSCSPDRSSLNTCNANGSDFADQQSCGGNGCDQGNLRCNLCKPGQRMCSGDTLLSCNADGQSMDMTRCEPSDDNGCRLATCEGSACAPGLRDVGTTCPGGRCNQRGACVECLEAEHCPAVDACHARSCSARGSCEVQAQPDGTGCGGNKRCMQGKCEAPPKTVALTSWWSAERGDNFTSGTAAGEADARAAGYSLVRVEAYAFETQQPGTVPLKLFWSAERGDNFTTGTPEGEADARAAGYQSVRPEAYAYPTEQPGTVALKSYWSAMRGDNFSTATQAGENDALAAGYDYVRVEAWVLSSPNP